MGHDPEFALRVQVMSPDVPFFVSFVLFVVKSRVVLEVVRCREWFLTLNVDWTWRVSPVKEGVSMEQK